MIQDVLENRKRWAVVQSDCIAFLDQLPADSVDLVLGSPPYMDARTYSRDDVSLGCQEWVDWMLKVTAAAVRVSKGLVLWVVSGVQRDKCYWPGCEGLAWEWWKAGNHLWRPCIWWKVDEDEGGTGIPGSGGKQWLRNDWEYVLAFKREGWLPWADPLVMGHEPVYGQVGGAMSNRTADGRRINEAAQAQEKRKWSDDPWQKRGRGNNLGGRTRDGRKNVGTTSRQNGEYKAVERDMPAIGAKGADGEQRVRESRPMPKVANPGNCIVVKARVGGGHMGSSLCHENEAPYPEALAEFFVLSFCQPGGVTCDPFSGSGTTGAVCLRHGRRFIGCDVRESQVELSRRRIGAETPSLFSQEQPHA